MIIFLVKKMCMCIYVVIIVNTVMSYVNNLQ